MIHTRIVFGLADHLAQFQELLGKIPKSVALSGRYSLELFNRKGELRNIRKLKFWDLKSVLSEKYKMSTEEAESLASFLQPMLDFDPEKRAKAGCSMIDDGPTKSIFGDDGV